MCDCIKTINQKIAPQNATLSLIISFGSPVSEYPRIPLDKLDKSKRGKIPTNFIPSFCPFCGEEYARTKKGGGA